MRYERLDAISRSVISTSVHHYLNLDEDPSFIESITYQPKGSPDREGNGEIPYKISAPAEKRIGEWFDHIMDYFMTT